MRSIPIPIRGRRQAVREGGHVVFVVEHRRVIACRFGVHLILEALRLVFGIVQLAETVTDFAAADEEFKAVSDFRVDVVTARRAEKLPPGIW